MLNLRVGRWSSIEVWGLESRVPVRVSAREMGVRRSIMVGGYGNWVSIDWTQEEDVQEKTG